MKSIKYEAAHVSLNYVEARDLTRKSEGFFAGSLKSQLIGCFQCHIVSWEQVEGAFGTFMIIRPSFLCIVIG